MSTEDELERDVRNAIRAARSRGAATFHEILQLCEGADPRLVLRMMDSDPATPVEHSAAVARRETSELASIFPAADPLACQWWFTLDTIEQLVDRVYQIAEPNAKVAFVGVPTVGYQFSRRSRGGTVFEIDDHVLQVVRSDELRAVSYDVAHDLPHGEAETYGVVLVDPPWYPEMLRAFLQRALQLAKPGASVLCSLPPRLTRPGIVDERQQLLQELLAAEIEVVSIERSVTRYLVPEFERVALRDVEQFDARPWRSGDLLHLRRKSVAKLPAVDVRPHDTLAFARDSRHYRVFLRRGCRSTPGMPTWIERNERFEHTVSRRAVAPADLHWWTSDKRGGTLRDPLLVEKALRLWANERKSLSETRDLLVDASLGVSPDHTRALCQDLDDNLGLWSVHGGSNVRNFPELAVEETAGRLYPKLGEDGYRGPFQHDRDRVTWSRGLRQLASKTQVFPLGASDFLRNRLSHSLEVVQLAATIGTSFDLNASLIEAGALAHDIGHTPFGHAGEKALHDLFAGLKSELGFNHYEHGVDVVRWLEDAYQSPALGGLFGLNITPEVAECIFKHTYCHSGGEGCQEQLYARSKHQDYFRNDRCHLEGQAVRIADKVLYLISDLEDGLRIRALTLDDLLDCRLLRRPPVDLVLGPGESPYERFLSQRSLLIGVLMEDIIEATARRLTHITSLAEVRRASRYMVDHSDEMAADVNEVWLKLQEGRLHKDGRVRIANLRAARIVRELTLLFAVAPELVDDRFRDGHARLRGSKYLEFYRHLTGTTANLDGAGLDFMVQDRGAALGFAPGKTQEVPIEDLVQAKDFVAGLSDERAGALHHELLGT